MVFAIFKLSESCLIEALAAATNDCSVTAVIEARYKASHKKPSVSVKSFWERTALANYVDILYASWMISKSPLQTWNIPYLWGYFLPFKLQHLSLKLLFSFHPPPRLLQSTSNPSLETLSAPTISIILYYL